MKTKLIQKIKEDFLSKKHELWHNEVCPFWIGYGKCDCHMPEIWNFIEKAISQSKEELVEKIKNIKTEKYQYSWTLDYHCRYCGIDKGMEHLGACDFLIESNRNAVINQVVKLLEDLNKK